MQALKLVILDRDGVINEDSPAFIKSPEEWHPIEGSLEAIGQLNRAGIKVAVATNQSGIAHGLYTVETLDKIHAKMQASLKAVGAHVDGIFFCPHGPEDACSCRKPKPGLLQCIAKQFEIDFKKTQTPCIGDSLRDLEAARTIGARPILVLTGKGKKTSANLSGTLQDISQFSSLADAIRELLKP